MQTLKERAQHVMRKGSIEDYENFVQEIANAPTPEPFGYFKAEPFGWTDCAETDDGAIALFAAPPAPSVPDGWKLVPVESTPETIAAIEKQWMIGSTIDMAEREYKAMLAAAPTPAEPPANLARDAERLRLFEQWTEMGYEHTKEPRFEVETESDVIEITNDERNGAIVPIAEVSTGFNGQIGIEQEANARRIVACVNACEGIPTGVLEKQGMVPIEQVTHDIEQQRDKLLAALEGLTDDICSLIDESSGVANLHLNGDIAFWSELEAGGQFERLTHLPDALRIIAEVKGQP